MDLYKILQCLLRIPRGVQHGALYQLMTTRAINDVLDGSALADGLDADTNNLSFIVFKRWVELGAAALVHQHQKGRMLILLYQRMIMIKDSLDELKNIYQRLLASLSNRAEAHELAMYVTRQHQAAMEDVKRYLSFYEEDIVVNINMFIPDHQTLQDFSFLNANGANTVVEQNQVWYFHHASDTINPLHLAPLNEYSEALGPILAGIRSFTQTDRDSALEKARNIKPEVTTLMSSIGDFLDKPPEQRSLGAAKAFRSSLINIKTILEGLLPHGISMSEGIVGTSTLLMVQHQSELENLIQEKESERRMAENQARIEASEVSRSAPTLKLPDLFGFVNWLSWRNSAEALLPLHKNELVKKQILRNSLRNQEDILRTKDLDSQQAFEYLTHRYDSPHLVPKLLEELLKMKKATDSHSSYRNLTAFISLYSQLVKQKAEEKLDSAFREKICPIILHGANLAIFYRDLAKHEKQLIRDEAPDPDNISMITHAQSEEAEYQRRQFFVKEMKDYLAVNRRIVSLSSSDGGDERPRGRGHKNYATQSLNYTCPVCNEKHMTREGKPTTSLHNCKRFLAMDVKGRIATARKNQMCLRCLRSKSDPEHVSTDGKSCKIATERGWVCGRCVPPSKTHCSLVHDPDIAQGQSGTRGSGHGKPPGRGGRGGGRGGSRGRGRRGGHHARCTGHCGQQQGATPSPGAGDGGGESQTDADCHCDWCEDTDESHHEESLVEEIQSAGNITSPLSLIHISEPTRRP